MKKTIHFIVVIMLMAVISCSSNDTPSQLKKINELQNKGFPITSEQQADIDKYTAQGNGLIKEGTAGLSILERRQSKAISDLRGIAVDRQIANRTEVLEVRQRHFIVDNRDDGRPRYQQNPAAIDVVDRNAERLDRFQQRVVKNRNRNRFGRFALVKRQCTADGRVVGDRVRGSQFGVVVDRDLPIGT